MATDRKRRMRAAYRKGVTNSIKWIDTLVESLQEGLMTDAGLTEQDRRAMRDQIAALDEAKATITVNEIDPHPGASVACQR